MICNYLPHTEPIIFGRIVDGLDFPEGYIGVPQVWIGREDDGLGIIPVFRKGGHLRRAAMPESIWWWLDATPFWQRGDGTHTIKIIGRYKPS